MLAAYNWGPGALDGAIRRNGDDMSAVMAKAPAETRKYVKQGLALYQGTPVHHSQDQPRDNGRFASAGPKPTKTPSPTNPAPKPSATARTIKGSNGNTITIEEVK